MCLVALLCYELITYPWGTARVDGAALISADMPDPTPPPFEFEWLPNPFATDDNPTGFNVNAYNQPRPPQATRLSTARTENVAVGYIKIGRLDLSEYIWYGAEEQQLREGIGFMPETQLPHLDGNFVLTGHRTHSRSEPFRYLNLMQIGDYVTVVYFGMNFNYKVDDIFVVGATDTWVLEPCDTDAQILTLLTCDPIVWIGRRPNRLIVRAVLVDITESN